MSSSSVRPVALVTGPTSGLGAGFANKLASQGYDLILVARDEERLAELSSDLERRYGAQCEVLPTDLSTQSGREAVAQRLEKGVQFLVNNAGAGLVGEFWTIDPADLQRQLDLNVTAVMQLTRAALPTMIAAAKGRIVNVASVAGLVAGRGSTYSASKAYVVSFTEGLAGGLEGTGVQIQALCPGLVHTEFHERAGLVLDSLPKMLWLNVDHVVATSLEDLEAGKVISIPGLQYKALATVSRMMPRGVARRVGSIVGKGRGRT
jgi:uncharacterized protein